MIPSIPPYPRTGKNPLQIAREVFPEIAEGRNGDTWLINVIYECTGYSDFWLDGWWRRHFRKQLQTYHDSAEGIEDIKHAGLNQMSDEDDEPIREDNTPL